MLRLFLMALGGSLLCSVASAQQGTPAGGAVSSADVYIESVVGSITNNEFVCTVKVNNQNDDDSYGTTVIVLLPLQVEKIINLTVKGRGGKCIRGPQHGNYFEYATCSLDPLPINGPSQIVEITTSASTALPGYPETCGAFVYSQMGDIKKDNNYMASQPVP